MGKKGKGKKLASSGDAQAQASGVGTEQATPAGGSRGQQQGVQASRSFEHGAEQLQQQSTATEAPAPAVQAQSSHVAQREPATGRQEQETLNVKTVQSVSQPADELKLKQRRKGHKGKQQPIPVAVQPQSQVTADVTTAQPISQSADEFAQWTTQKGRKMTQQRPTPVADAPQPQIAVHSQPTEAQHVQQQMPSPARGRGSAVWGPGRGTGRGQPQPAGRGAVRGRGQPGRSDVPPGMAPGRVSQVFEKPGPSGGALYRPQQQPLAVPAQHQPTRPQLQEPTTAVETVKKPAEEPKWKLAIPQRGNLRKGGTKGKPLTVETNHLSLKIDPKFEIAIHYDVTITPDRPKRMMRLVWESFRRQYLSQYAFAFDDACNAYSPTRLSDDVTGEVLVAEDSFSQPKQYNVLVRFAAEVNLGALFSYMESGCSTDLPRDALQCIDIVLRNASALRFVRVGRSHFSEPPGRIVSLTGGLQLWTGLFKSAVIGWKPFLNVDVVHKGFIIPQPISDLIADMVRNPNQISDNDIEKISKLLRGVKVRYQIPRRPESLRTYRVNGLVQPPRNAMFDLDGTQTSVFQYFKEQKGYNIQDQRLPCLWVGPRNRESKIYLPSELCTIMPGQVFSRKLNDIQTTKIIRFANTSTSIRKENIMNSVKDVNFNEDPVVQEFGLSVGKDFEKIPARFLEPPKLKYENRIVTPAAGVWPANKFLSAQHLPPNSWTIINLDDSIQNNYLGNFVSMLQQAARQVGMNIANPEMPFPRIQRYSARQVEHMLQEYKNKKVLFVIVPSYPPNIYHKVKQTAELNVGCLTQCVKSETMLEKMNMTTARNILLKVNAKLNGQNHEIAKVSLPQCLKEPCMIMGADVTHPSPDQTDIPSVAAVTASYDASAFKYNYISRLQPARREIIDDLENIVKTQLKFFYNQTQQKPKRIIFFRDGVAESQFQEVMNVEMQAIRRACASMGTPGSYQPPITFLVVQKRHHTRFFPTNKAESEDRNNNVRAGTVVDTTITHPTSLDYYLVSHASIQGVARPTKYRMLWDDTNMSDEDELEELTYYLCHMFSRCTRSVSYPAPTYYAHLAASRARVHLHGHQVNTNNLTKEQADHAIHEDFLRKQPMFFV